MILFTNFRQPISRRADPFMKMDSIYTHLADVFSTFRSRALGGGSTRGWSLEGSTSTACVRHTRGPYWLGPPVGGAKELWPSSYYCILAQSGAFQDSETHRPPNKSDCLFFFRIVLYTFISIPRNVKKIRKRRRRRRKKKKCFRSRLSWWWPAFCWIQPNQLNQVFIRNMCCSLWQLYWRSQFILNMCNMIENRTSVWDGFSLDVGQEPGILCRRLLRRRRPMQCRTPPHCTLNSLV